MILATASGAATEFDWSTVVAASIAGLVALAVALINLAAVKRTNSAAQKHKETVDALILVSKASQTSAENVVNQTFAQLNRLQDTLSKAVSALARSAPSPGATGRARRR